MDPGLKTRLRKFRPLTPERLRGEKYPPVALE
jgi:hypothetical protein